MVNTTLGLKNINLLTKEQYDGISDLSIEELYAVEIPTVVETYSDDNGNWYRIYSDGWVEQGGIAVAGVNNLLKAFNTNKFRMGLSPNGSTHSYVSARTTTTFTITGGACDWIACGQGD